MPTCFNCGNQVSERSNFCPDCGTQLKEMPPEIAAIVAGRTEEERLTPKPVTRKVVFSGAGIKK